jgi:ABC-2 type transport system permease protein
MTALVRAELLKLRTTRTALGFAIAGVLLVILVVLVGTLAGNPVTIADKRRILSVGDPLFVVLLIFGVVGATSEYRHRTVAAAALIVPHRLRLTVGRMLAYALAGLLVALVMIVVALVIGIPLLSSTQGPALQAGDYARAIGSGLLACTMATTLGVGIGVLVASQVTAVVGTLIWLFVIEPLIGVASRTAGEYTFGQSLSAMSGTGGRHLLGFWAACGVSAAWTLALLAIAAVVDRRRDIS